jgi:hypothetical protein
MGCLARPGSLPRFGTWKAYHAMIVVIDEGIAVMKRRAAAASPGPRLTLNYFAANLSKLTIILFLPS